MTTCRWAELAEVLDPGGGDDAPPRRITIWYGPNLAESWIESGFRIYVRTPDHDADPLEHLTPEMRRLIRPDDELVVFMSFHGGSRDSHLQTDRPPWRRKPWRSAGPGKFEIETSPGVWEELP